MGERRKILRKYYRQMAGWLDLALVICISGTIYFQLSFPTLSSTTSHYFHRHTFNSLGNLYWDKNILIFSQFPLSFSTTNS